MNGRLATKYSYGSDFCHQMLQPCIACEASYDDNFYCQYTNLVNYE